MPKAIELNKGDVFGRLTCSGEYKKIKSRRWYIFSCACGNEKLAQAKEVLSKKISSCGCLQVEMARKRKYLGRDEAKRNGVYKAWAGMISRCKNEKNPNFKSYGGRGIKVCDRWKSFDLFHEDMGDRPSKEHSIGRINNDGNYEPSNCRWENRLEQANNTRRNRFINLDGEKITVSQAARKRGVHPDTVYERLNRGLSVEDALSKCSYNVLLVNLNGEMLKLGEARERLKIPTSTYYKRKKQGFFAQEIIDSYAGIKPLNLKR